MSDSETDPIAAALADGEEHGYERGIRDERTRIRGELETVIDSEWEVLFTGTRYDSEMVKGIRLATLTEALDRIFTREKP